MIGTVLPHGWAPTQLGKILLEVVGGGTPSRNVPAYFNGTIPWFTVKDMKALRPNDAKEHISQTAVNDSATNVIPANTVIVATRIALGRAIMPTVACAINQDLKALIVGSGVNSNFLLHWICANERVIQDLGSGTTVSGIRLETLNALPLNLPPSKEQTRIIEKLEELLSDLDAGVAELKTAQKKLAQYRQSLLKAAVEGSLTAVWREQQYTAAARHAQPLETGEQLLERTLIERRRRWEEKQLAKFIEQSKVPPKDWQDKYPEPLQPNTFDLPVLPKGWAWASLDMLGEIVSGVAKGTKRDSDIVVREVSYLRVANVQRGYLDLAEVKKILATERDIAELTLQYGDILFNEGGDRDKLGRGWVWRDEVSDCIHQNHVFRMRPYLRETLPELISHHGNTFGKFWFQTAGKQTTNLASINMTILRTFPVPVAPAIEQQEILALLVAQLDPLVEQERSVEIGLRQAEAQRKNILKAAFSGQLVPQDPNVEPASVLLERIQQERISRLTEKPKARNEKSRRSMKNKPTVDSVRETIRTFSNNSFSFEDLNDALGTSYGDLKDIVFLLLKEKSPSLKQQFDTNSGSMRFVKV